LSECSDLNLFIFAGWKIFKGLVGISYVINRNFVERLIKDIYDSIESIREITSKDFESMSKAERLAVRYNIITISESLSALILHIVRKMLNESPDNVHEALILLEERKFIGRTEREEISGLMRLRNILVHRYWIVDDYLVYQNVKEDFEIVEKLIERIRDEFGV
jgi:uncharacterized protein YutE (UPF0331/DUF86 family)